MTNSNDLFVLAIGCDDQKFQFVKNAIQNVHPDVDVVMGTHSASPLAIGLVVNGLINQIKSTPKGFVALVETNFLSSQLLGKEWMAEYQSLCGKPNQLLCHNVTAQNFISSQRFINANDFCLGRKEDVLKSVFMQG